MLDIGFRAHDFGFADSLDSFIETVHHYVSGGKLHLAPHKTIRNLLPWTEWTEDYASSIKDKLHANGIEIEVLGCTINPVHPDPKMRRLEIERYKKNIRLAECFGAAIVGTETGSWSPAISYSAETFEPYVYDILLSSLDEMLNEAIKHDAVIGIEPAAYIHTICSPERLRRVLETFDDEHFMVTMDPVNLIPRSGIAEPDGSYRRCPTKEAQREYYTPLLEDFRERIAVLHAKDFKLTDEGFKKGDLTALTGVFDWEGFLSLVKRLDLNVPIILENMNPDTLSDTIEKLNALYDHA